MKKKNRKKLDKHLRNFGAGLDDGVISINELVPDDELYLKDIKSKKNKKKMLLHINDYLDRLARFEEDTTDRPLLTDLASIVLPLLRINNSESLRMKILVERVPHKNDDIIYID